MREMLTWFAFGWLCGGVVLWVYFKWSKLIRSREEWERANAQSPEAR